jgi:hypothetical protein
MKPPFPKINRRVFEFIRNLDPNPKNIRPVTFWFYSESELNIYRLASHLQNAGYRIVTCEPFINGEYLCIAELKMPPDNDRINQLCIDMHLLAERMQVVFDGWETEMHLPERE